MSITREQLKVGETYVNNDGDMKRKVLAVGEGYVFYRWSRVRDTGERTMSISSFLETHNIIKPEPKKIGEVAWFMIKSNGELVGVINGKDDCFMRDENYQRVTIKDNEIWEFYE